MNKILHIAPDEKFIDFVIDVFDQSETIENHYIIATKKQRELKYIKNTKRVKVALPHELLSESFIGTLPQYKAVLIHKFYGVGVDLINRCNENIVFICFTWGVDIYHQHPKLRNNLWLKSTNLISWKTETSYRLKLLLKPLVDILGLKEEVYKSQEKALKKIKYIAPVIPQDYDLLLQHYKNAAETKMLKFSYGDTNSFVRGVNCVKGNNILLGNSSSATNNHTEIIDLLADVDLADKKIYTPLNYGNVKYAEHIINYAKKKLGQHFVGMTDFLPIDEYLKVISSCEFVIMNHKRQQGMGNIYAMLFLGAKVFLRKDNPAYCYLCDQGILVSDTADLTNENGFKPLNQAEKKHNNEIINGLFAPEVVRNYVETMINIVISEP